MESKLGAPPPQVLWPVPGGPGLLLPPRAGGRHPTGQQLYWSRSVPDGQGDTRLICSLIQYSYVTAFSCSVTPPPVAGPERKVSLRSLLVTDTPARFGFSEYNADTYGPIAFTALVTVAALAPDPEVPVSSSSPCRPSVAGADLGPDDPDPADV